MCLKTMSSFTSSLRIPSDERLSMALVKKEGHYPRKGLAGLGSYIPENSSLDKLMDDPNPSVGIISSYIGKIMEFGNQMAPIYS